MMEGVFVYDDLSDLAERLGRHMAEQCADGLPGHFGDELLDAFPGETPESLTGALAELKADGLIELTSVIGPKLPRVYTTYDLFAATDAAVTGNDPVVDSVVLAQLMADDPELGSVQQLQQAVSWDRRRFNPAVGLLLPLFPDGRYSKECQADYPTRYFLVTADEAVALRRYARTHS